MVPPERTRLDGARPQFSLARSATWISMASWHQLCDVGAVGEERARSQYRMDPGEDTPSSPPGRNDLLHTQPQLAQHEPEQPGSDAPTRAEPDQTSKGYTSPTESGMIESAVDRNPAGGDTEPFSPTASTILETATGDGGPSGVVSPALGPDHGTLSSVPPLRNAVDVDLPSLPGVPRPVAIEMLNAEPADAIPGGDTETSESREPKYITPERSPAQSPPRSPQSLPHVPSVLSRQNSDPMGGPPVSVTGGGRKSSMAVGLERFFKKFQRGSAQIAPEDVPVEKAKPQVKRYSNDGEVELEWWEPGRVKEFRLVRRQDAPPVIRYPFILNYYRVNFSVWLCIKSIFRVHNETINIWTHMLAVPLFIALWIVSMSYYIPEVLGNATNEGRDDDWMHYIAFSVFILGATASWTASTHYHTFLCYSKNYSFVCGIGDYGGIFLNIYSNVFPTIFYLFDCHKVERIVYLVISFIFTAFLGIQILFRKFHTSFRPWAYWRLFAYLGHLAVSFIPILHYLIIVDWTDLFILNLLGRFTITGVLFGASMCIHTLKIPERFSPGTFDILLCSHHWMHVGVAVAGISQWLTLLFLIDFNVNNSCSSRNITSF